MAHRFTDIAAQGAMLSIGSPILTCWPSAPSRLVNASKALGGPVIHRFTWRALNIVPAAVSSHTCKGETVLVIGVYHIVGNRGLVDQNTQPAKGIFALKFLQLCTGYRLATNTMKTITARDNIAFDRDFAFAASLKETLGVSVSKSANCVGTVPVNFLTPRFTGVDQVFRNLGLAINDHMMPSDVLHWNFNLITVEAENDAVVVNALCHETLRAIGLVHGVNSPTLQHTSTDTFKNACTACALHHDAVNAFKVQQLAQ